jgi:hypothetical protein
MIETGLVTFLNADTGVSAITGTRIYPMILPQNPTYPAITYSRNSVDRDMTLEEGQTDFASADIQIDAWSTSYSGAKTLWQAIKDAIQNFQGSMGAIAVQRAFVVGDLDVYEPDVGAYRCSMTVSIWHTEA